MAGLWSNVFTHSFMGQNSLGTAAQRLQNRGTKFELAFDIFISLIRIMMVNPKPINFSQVCQATNLA